MWPRAAGRPCGLVVPFNKTRTFPHSCREVATSSLGQDIPLAFWTRKVHRRDHKSPPPPLSQAITPLHHILFLSAPFHLHLVLPSGLSKPTLYTFLVSRALYVLRPSYVPWVRHLNNLNTMNSTISEAPRHAVFSSVVQFISLYFQIFHPNPPPLPPSTTISCTFCWIKQKISQTGNMTVV